MNDSRWLAPQRNHVGDVAVDGLFAGVVGGGLMAGYLVLAGLTAGESPTTMLSRFTPDGQGGAWQGTLGHLAVAGIYGLLFALGRRHTPIARSHTLAAGLAYGMVLLLVAQILVLPTAGSPLLDIPFVHWAAAHALYGLALGYLIGRAH